MSQLKTEEWDAMININIRGVLNAVAAVLPELDRSLRHRLLPAHGLYLAMQYNAVYCGTKYFVKAMMDSFCQENIAEGNRIRTTTLYPGAINTELLGTINDANIKNAVEDIYKKVGISPDAIANAVL